MTVERKKKGRKQIACKDVTVSLSVVYESEYGYYDLEETYLRIVVKKRVGYRKKGFCDDCGKTAGKKRMACKDATVSFLVTIVYDM